MKKKRVVKKTRSLKKKNRRVVFGLFVLVGVLLVVLVGLAMFNAGVFEKTESPKLFNIKDECALVMGNLVHQVRDRGECRIKCVNECDVRGMDFSNFSFEGKNDDCNSCGCWCK